MRSRLVVISDLHLGGAAPHMMSQPRALGEFFLSQKDPQDLHLVINGDFIDFLAQPDVDGKTLAWTSNPQQAAEKLRQIMEGDHAPAFLGLRGLLKAGAVVTVIVGNHDVELTLPQVQETLWRGLDTDPHQLRFVDDGRALRIGDVLIEHGNRYDLSNQNDWDGLRAWASCASRGEEAPEAVKVSGGSRFVERVVNPLKNPPKKPGHPTKPSYPFVDLLQPGGDLLACLLLEFEPALSWDIDKLAACLREGVRQQRPDHSSGERPGSTHKVSAQAPDPELPELRELYAELWRALEHPANKVSALESWVEAFHRCNDQGLQELIQAGKPIPEARLNRIQRLLRRYEHPQDPQTWSGPVEAYERAAQRLRSAPGGPTLVIMGHTHQAKVLPSADTPSYINTGTWADIITVPQGALSDLSQLDEFLRLLLQDEARRFCPGWADVKLQDGRVVHARLRTDLPRP